jgi:hypothetical protein
VRQHLRGRSSYVRALASHARGTGFDSLRLPLLFPRSVFYFSFAFLLLAGKYREKRPSFFHSLFSLIQTLLGLLLFSSAVFYFSFPFLLLVRKYWEKGAMVSIPPVSTYYFR